MQTFLPYDDFAASAVALDYRRLGKQRVESLQIYQTLTVGGGWKNHPAIKMWQGHEWWLLSYAVEMCCEWRRRGYRDNLLPRFLDAIDPIEIVPQPPPWLGLEELHSSHRANLIRKDPKHYGAFGWTEQPADGYWWPK